MSRAGHLLEQLELLDADSGNQLRISVNPRNKRDLQRDLKPGPDQDCFRVLIQDGKTYWCDAYQTVHQEMADLLGVPIIGASTIYMNMRDGQWSLSNEDPTNWANSTDQSLVNQVVGS